MNASWIRDFQHPGCAFRGAPFWAWNGTLDPQELRRQIRLMRKMGLGGFFMHSRVGLNTAYLSRDWFACLRACVEEAEKEGMRAWLYDEDRWPSGAAGGLVTRNPRYRMRRLHVERVHNPNALRWTPETLAVFTAQLDRHIARSVRLLPRGDRPRKLSDAETILRFHVVSSPCSDWYNGYTYLDTLSHEAVRAFIRTTHEAYRREIGHAFGKTVPGIFTDEPNYGRVMGLPWGKPRLMVPWTPRLPEVFRRRYGYDIIPHLPEIFWDVDNVPITPTRWHYYDCITYLFVDAFARQIGEWCERNGLEHTGHVLGEETLSSQTGVVGSSLRFYEYMQAPGMDILTEYSRQYDTAKAVSSVARQFGRRWRLTETYGCTGWDFPWVGHKAIGDWQVALGITLRCQHLAWYTMEGQAKRDYPASIFYQSPWWAFYNKVEDYFARIHAVMTRGVEVRDLLVVHPVESMWVTFRFTTEDRVPGIRELDAMLIALRDSLLTAGIDFDYGDEDMLARLGAIRRVRGLPILQVHRAPYRAVIVPPLKTIRSTTLRLLRAFRDMGGTVVFAGTIPDHVDAKPSVEARELAERCVHAPAKGIALARSVEPVARRVSIRDARGRFVRSSLHLLREDAEAFYFFVCNTGERRFRPGIGTPTMIRDKTLAFPDVRILGFAGCKGHPLELDPETGAVYTAKAIQQKGQWEIHTSLPALGSRLFVIPKRREHKRFPSRPRLTVARIRTLSSHRWAIRLSEPNVLVLDRPRYAFGDGPWEGPQEILRVDEAVRRALGVKPRGGEMVQPWARPSTHRIRTMPIRLTYSFDVETLPSGEVFLAIERPHTFAMDVNGVALCADVASGWWCDRSLRKIPIPSGALRLGSNTLTLSGTYSEDHPGLEIIYLLGIFGVRVKGHAVAITPAPTRLRLGDWVKQGLPFYAGSVIYGQTIRPRLQKGERLFVQVPDYRGVAVRVLLNGEPAGIIAWEPHELELTRLLRRGSNVLEIEVLGHRRNSHGPLHGATKWPRWTGPEEFLYREGRWVEGYQLVPCGLMQPPRVVVKR